MKFIKMALSALVLCSTLVFATGCGEKVEEVVQEEVTADIIRGDLSLDVSAIGNLTFSEIDNLNFDLAGTVTDVLAEVGDIVEEGQVLAKLDISERDDYLKTLTRSIELKDQALLQAEINQQNAVNSLEEINSQAYVDQKKAQARLDVTNAETALAGAETAFEAAEYVYYQNWTVPESIRDYEKKQILLSIAELNLAEAEKTLAEIDDVIALEREIKEKELVIVESKLEDAQKEYNDAVEELAEAQKQSWEIVAPFRGNITKVNIAIGQEVQRSTSAFEIADPDEFEAEVSVSEMDIANVVIGTTATIQVEAMQSMILPARVVKIAPTANIQSGVVNYAVKVKIDAADLTAMAMDQSMEDALAEAAEAIESGELPDKLREMVDEGIMTQEQAEAIVENMQSGNIPERSQSQASVPSLEPGVNDEVVVTPGGFGFSSSDTMDTGGFQMPVMSTGSGFQLMEGLTVMVSIKTESRTDVLLVPSGAITTRNGQSFVTVLKSDDTREERAIVTGLSDWQNTEVISGLSEGEQVVYTPVSDSSDMFDYGGFMGPSIVRSVR